MSFESTSWTTTVPHPFATAPGAGGLGNTRRRAATVAFESGFAAEPVGAEYVLPGSVVKAQGPFRVSKKPVLAGQIPAALIQIYFTDRGAINQGSLDQGVYTPIQGRGFRMSASKFEPISVQWGWRKQAAADKYTKDLYFPVVVAPKSIEGMVYSGSAISSAELMDANFAPTAALLARLPKQIWVYTFGVTNPNDQFTDADGAQVLTLLKAAWSNTLPQAGASAYGYVTLLGADPSVFNGPSPTPVGGKKSPWLWLLGAAVLYSQMG